MQFSTKGPFINYVMHLGGEGVAVALRSVMEGGGGVKEVVYLFVLLKVLYTTL